MHDPDPNDSPRIADAEALFRDDSKTSEPIAPPASATTGSAGQYELDDDGVEPPANVVNPAPFAVEPRKRSTTAPAHEKPLRPEPSEAVDEVWSRGAEWGGTIAILAGVAVAVVIVLYLLMSLELIGTAFLVLLASIPVMVFVSYPILITLERPVRVTPEQAVRDYFSALSHHFPHYKRMWLLLSSAGRVSGSFASFEGFRTYWQTRLTELRAGHASGMTPLKFQVDDFKAEKSAGLSTISVKYTIHVFVRGRLADGPIATVRQTQSLVKGPDRMWYLNEGTFR